MTSIYHRKNLGRADLAIDGVALEQDIANRVQRGEFVRITSLGTLVPFCASRGTDVAGPSQGYRLTLTAAVAKTLEHVRTLQAGPIPRLAPVIESVEYLARALGADVEVWAPVRARHGAMTHPSALITTVAP